MPTTYHRYNIILSFSVAYHIKAGMPCRRQQEQQIVSKCGARTAVVIVDPPLRKIMDRFRSMESSC